MSGAQDGVTGRGTRRRRVRRAPVVAVLVAAGLAAAVPLTAVLADTAFDLPDLVGDAPAHPYIQNFVGDMPGQGQVDRLLMRFDGYVHNAGSAPLDFQGDPSQGTVRQWAQPQGGGPLQQYPLAPGDTAPQFIYETADGHNHWHLVSAEEYSLWDENQAAQIKAGAKTGFCLYDIERVGTQGPTDAVYDSMMTNDFCDRGNPSATSLREGLSAGWRDLYDAGLSYQWVDVSDVAPGRYWLASRPDPDDVVRESDETNNGVVFSAGMVTVPGYVAKAVSVQTLAGRVVSVPLSATTFGDDAFGHPGALRFRIRTVPSQGSLSNAGNPLAAGDLLPAGVTSVSYTAPATFTGSSTSFTFTAEPVNSRFPTDATGAWQSGAVQATAVVGVGGFQQATVGIAGAPSTMATGAVAQLRSIVTNAAPDVVWSVDGIVGGSDVVGRITGAGVYTAPTSAPPAGFVMIRATSVEVPSAWTEAKVVVGGTMPTGAAPAPGSGLRPGELLSKPTVLVRGTSHVATVTVAVRGRVVITAELAGRRLAGCSASVLAGQSLSCAMMPRATTGVVVYARFRAADGRRRTTRVSLSGSVGVGTLRVRRVGRRVSVAVPAERAGTMTAEIAVSDRVVARCRSRVVVGQVLTCARVLPAGTSGRVTITASLRSPASVGLRRVSLG